MHLGDHGARCVLCVAQGWDDEGVVGHAEGPLGERARLPAQHLVEHVDGLDDVFGLEERRTHRLGGAHGHRVGAVQVEVPGLDHVAGHERPDVEVDVFERVDEAGHVVDVVEIRWAVLAGFVVPDGDGRACGAEVDPVAAHVYGPVVVEAMPGERLGGHVHGILDE